MGSTLPAADRIRALILLLLIGLGAFAQEPDYYRQGFFRYSNYIYDPAIHTVILEPLNRPMSDPVITLRTGEQLVLRFDDFSLEAGNYSYRFQHCTADWQPSSLSETEFLEGFFTEQISTYRHSRSTQQPYFHYRVEFPSQYMKIKISGNYLLVVYDTSDPEKVMLTRRFFVTENQVSISARIHQATAIDLRYSHQEADFKLNTTLPLRNPYQDLKVVVVQNNRWDIALRQLKPQFVNDGVLEYDLEDGNVLPGTNEFRFADLRTLQFQTASMERMGRDSISGLPSVLLKKDVRRATERYSVQDDINGRFLVKVYDDRDGDTEAEYILTKFRLGVSAEFDSSDVFVFGEYNQWNLDNRNKMSYSPEERCYVLETVLKQGYYNYQYLVRGSDGIASASETEGDRFETGNDYAFYIYWSDPQVRYDRLVGWQVFTQAR